MYDRERGRVIDLLPDGKPPRPQSRHSRLRILWLRWSPKIARALMEAPLQKLSKWQTVGIC